MTNIVLHEQHWACAMLPEGIVESWLVDDGATVGKNQALATVRIEGGLHDILAPEAGRLAITAPVNAVVEPGSVLGVVEPQ